MVSNRASVRVALVACALSLMACTPAERKPAQPVPAAVPEVQRPATLQEGAGTPQHVMQLPVLQPVAAPPKVSPAERTFRNLRTSPEKGVIGTPFTLSGDGFRPGQEVELQWATWDGSYATKPSAETVAYESRKLVEQRLLLGRVKADVQGVIHGSYVSPEDFGELHEIYALTDGAEVARGGFRILMDASIDPSEGAVGTPVTVTVTGMAAKLFSGVTMALRYDNAYTGILTATTTRGTARAEFRAAGTVGPHVVIVNAGSVPAYLNIAQSPYAFVYAHLSTQEDFRLPFRVTADQGPPDNRIAWPAAERVLPQRADAPRTTASGVSVAGVSAQLEPAAGPVLSKPVLTVQGLIPNQPVDAFWMTARGNRVTPSGWSLAEIPLGAVTADANGRISGPVEVPDDLGGWHAVKLAQNGQVVAEAPYFVERSLVSVSAQKLRAGESFTVSIKGVGWTELDNGLAMTYDNAYVGYACGFNSNGDVTIELVATGGSGTHLIDLYPMVYAGKDAKWWYWTPVLTFARDFPALALGYRLPAFRLAIEVTD
jgi:hypothetical protein